MNVATPVRHLWIRGRQHDIDAALPPSRLLADVDGHQRLRGPYTAAGTVLRAIGPDLLDTEPGRRLATRYDIEILVAAPELGDRLACSRETLTSLSPPISRTRFYPYDRTTRIAHGLTELVRAYSSAIGGTRTLVIRNADQLEQTDLVWLATMLRRVDPADLRVVLCSATELAAPLADAVERHTEPIGELVAAGEPIVPGDPGVRHELARRYVGNDGTSDDSFQIGAYQACPDAERRQLHDERAGVLEVTGEMSLVLGAIAWHRENGSDPAAGAAAVARAMDHCVLHGFYDYVLELGRRCHRLLDWRTDPEACWLATVKMTIALSTMGRADEAMELYDDACANSTLAGVHMSAAYGRAMLYTRYYDPPRRDLRKAKAWVNTAIVISQGASDAKRRSYNLTFNENGLALIEMHLGDGDEALRRVNAGIARLETDLSPQEHQLHRSVLKYNRAQLIARGGDLVSALAEYDAVIDLDPNHSDYYFERAALRARAGRLDEAAADYLSAARTSPPYPEPHYNLGDLRLRQGDVEGALAEFDYVLELDPAFLDAYVNRAGIRYELGDVEAAQADVAAGLALAPAQPHLLCLRGLILQDAGRPDEARASFLAAIEADQRLAGAWANLGVLAFEQGDAAAALRYLDRALEIEDDPAVRENREIALRATSPDRAGSPT